MNTSCHTYQRVMSHISMSHISHMNESCHTYEPLTPHTLPPHTPYPLLYSAHYISHLISTQPTQPIQSTNYTGKSYTYHTLPPTLFQHTLPRIPFLPNLPSPYPKLSRYNTSHSVSAHPISSLQHTATHCNTLQRTATHCNTL